MSSDEGYVGKSYPEAAAAVWPEALSEDLHLPQSRCVKGYLFVSLGWMALSGPLAWSQQELDSPRFEIASVKPSDPKSTAGVGIYIYPGGKVVATQCPLKYLITEAFNVRPFQVTGGAGRMDERYDIEAKPPESSESIRSSPSSPKSPMNDEQRHMMRALLVDRFHLQFHREMKLTPVYFLEKTVLPLKLQAPTDGSIYSWAGPPQGANVIAGFGLAGKNISMQELAVRLSRFMDRTVIDHTQVEGTFDFEYRMGEYDPSADVANTIILSLKELGLRLKSARSPVETIAVDHVEEPSPN